MWGSFFFFLPESGINPSALVSVCHVTWPRWSAPAGLGGGGGSEAARASQRREGAAEASSARRGRSFLSPPPPVPAAPLHLSPALSPAPSLSPLLNWHRSGWKHDNRKAFRRGALSGSPRPRSPPTQISRRQRERGAARGSQRPTNGCSEGITRELYTARTHAHMCSRASQISESVQLDWKLRCTYAVWYARLLDL